MSLFSIIFTYKKGLQDDRKYKVTKVDRDQYLVTLDDAVRGTIEASHLMQRAVHEISMEVD